MEKLSQNKIFSQDSVDLIVDEFKCNNNECECKSGEKCSDGLLGVFIEFLDHNINIFSSLEINYDNIRRIITAFPQDGLEMSNGEGCCGLDWIEIQLLKIFSVYIPKKPRIKIGANSERVIQALSSYDYNDLENLEFFIKRMKFNKSKHQREKLDTLLFRIKNMHTNNENGMTFGKLFLGLTVSEEDEYFIMEYLLGRSTNYLGILLKEFIVEIYQSLKFRDRSEFNSKLVDLSINKYFANKPGMQAVKKFILEYIEINNDFKGSEEDFTKLIIELTYIIPISQLVNFADEYDSVSISNM